MRRRKIGKKRPQKRRPEPRRDSARDFHIGGFWRRRVEPDWRVMALYAKRSSASQTCPAHGWICLASRLRPVRIERFAGHSSCWAESTKTCDPHQVAFTSPGSAPLIWQTCASSIMRVARGCGAYPMTFLHTRQTEATTLSQQRVWLYFGCVLGICTMRNSVSPKAARRCEKRHKFGVLGVEYVG